MSKGLFIYTPSRDPFLNMAMDEWLFDEVCHGLLADSAILRIYSWSVPAITIGYNQDQNKAVDWGLHRSDTPVIRRITGGRGIFHESTEITFSLCGSGRSFSRFSQVARAGEFSDIDRNCQCPPPTWRQCRMGGILGFELWRE